MSGLQAVRASPHHLAQPAPDTVAHRGVADLVGDGEADTGFSPFAARRLQGERVPARAPAPGRPEKLGSLLEAARRPLLLRPGRHAARPLGRKLLAADGAAEVDDLAPVLGRHAGTETVAAGAHQLARLI